MLSTVPALTGLLAFGRCRQITTTELKEADTHCFFHYSGWITDGWFSCLFDVVVVVVVCWLVGWFCIVVVVH